MLQTGSGSLVIKSRLGSTRNIVVGHALEGACLSLIAFLARSRPIAAGLSQTTIPVDAANPHGNAGAGMLAGSMADTRAGCPEENRR